MSRSSSTPSFIKTMPLVPGLRVFNTRFPKREPPCVRAPFDVAAPSRRNGSSAGRARLSTLFVAFILISVAASALVVVRGRAAGFNFHWPAAVSKIFAGRSARTVNPPVPEPVAPSPSIGDVAVDINNTTIKKLNATDGTVLWTAAVTNDGALAVDPLDFGVYTGNGGHGSGSGTGYKYTSAGGLAWTNTITGAGCGFYYVNGAAVDTTSSSPGAVFSETSCFGGMAKTSRSTGAQQWSLSTNDIGRPSIDPANGQIFAVTVAGPAYNYKTIYRVNADGTGLTSAASCEGVTDLNPADSNLYRGGDMRTSGCGLNLSQINKTTLAANWTFAVPGITSFDTLAVQPWSGGYVYVGSVTDSKIVVVNPATQTVVTSFTTAVAPNVIAVNPSGGNLYLANSVNNFVYAYSPTGTLAWTSPDLGGPIYNLAAPRAFVGAPLLFWRTDGTAAQLWTGANWSNPASPTGGTAWTNGDDAEFTANSTLTYVTGTPFGNVTVDDGVSVTVTQAGTASAAAHTYNIGTGSTLTWTSQDFTVSGTSFIKNGAGTWNMGSNSNAYTGGFTLNTGTVIVSGNNSFGGSAFTINGGTIQSSGTHSYAPTAITLGGNFTMAGTGDATFVGTVGLGSATRTITNNQSSGTLNFSGVISGGSVVGLTFAGTGTNTLSNTNTYTGNTTINAGKLALTGAGSIANSPIIEVGGGATFDVSGLTTELTLASSQALKASGTTSTGTIATVAGKGLTTAANSPLQFTAFNGATAPLTISGNGTVTLASGNPVTSALGVGDYTLIAKGASGIVAGTAPTSLTIGGSGLAGGTSGSLLISGSQLVLHVSTAGSLQFSGAPYANSETNSNHTFTVNVSRTGSSSGAVAVNYAVTDGSANSPVDYTVSPASGTLNWTNGDSADKSFNITVKGDTTVESDETVTLTLSSATGGATIGSPNPTTLTITNDDSADQTFNASGNLSPGTYNNITINGPAVVTLTGDVIINGTITINTGGTLDCGGFIVSGPGTFTLNAGGTLAIGDVNGITTAACGTGGSCGSIRTTARTFDSGAGYTYDGTASQAVGNGLPSSVVNLTITNTGGGGNKTVTNLASQAVTGTLQVNSGIYSSHSDYVDVVINNAGTLSLAADITVSGNWTNNGTFISNGFKVTFDGNANQTIGGTNSTTFATLQVSNSGTSPANVVGLDGSLGATATTASALSVTSGVFDQGSAASSSNFTTTGSGTVATIASGANWRNLGTGDLTLSGDVSNSGTINFNANGATCGDADSILIRSTGVARTWSGTGTFSMIDVDVKDQKVPLVPPPLAILVNSGTDSTGNTGWVFVNQCTAGTYTWVGGANQDWQVPTNWNPTRTAPAAGDILIFDGTSTPAPIVTNVPTETDAALRLINGVNGVTLNASALGAQTLTLSGTTGSDLSVPTGTLLTLAGANGLTISLTGAGSQGSVGGQIILQGGPHRLIGSNAGEIIFASGSFFTASAAPAGFTGNPFGSVTADSVRFLSGSSAFFNAGSDPFGGAANVVTFSSGSTQTFNASSAFSANGRTYGNLTLDGSQTFFDSAATIQVNVFNNLTIQSGSTLKLSNAANGDLNLLSNFTNNGIFDPNGRTVKFQGASTTQTVDGAVTFFDVTISKTGGSVKVGNSVTINGLLRFDGTVDVLDITAADLTLNGTVGGTNATGTLDSTIYGANLHIGGTGAIGPLRYLGTQNLTALDVNRTSSGLVTFATNLNIGNGVSGGVTLTNGIVDMGPNTLSLATFPAVARTNGYVAGNLQKNFGALGNFTFPVGTANAYSPLDANVTANTSGALTVKAVQGKLPSISGTNALQRYWTLSGSGLTTDLTFHYNVVSPNDVVGNEALYKIFKYDGSFTQVPNQSIDTGAHTATATGVTSFSDWTLAEPTAIMPGTLQFVGAPYTDSETNANHTKTITVSRSGGTDGAIDVTYATSAGTATAGSDYVETTATLHWNDGETGNKTFDITVNGDATYEANETVNITLSDVTDGATITPPNPTTLTITNDDAVPANATLVVNTTDDNDFGACVTAHCSLREAINAANSLPDANTINFNIPNTDPNFAGGVYTIKPTVSLASITAPVTIDGTSQTTISDTNANGPEIELNGSLTTGANGLTISASNSTVKGLVVNGFANGIAIGSTNTSNNQILNNYVGTNAAGTAAVANASIGVSVATTTGSTISGNLISGNGTTGITTCDVSSTTFSNNLVGTDRTGVSNVGNGTQGMQTFCTTFTNNTISGNTFAFNGGDGYRDQPDYGGGPFLTGHINNRITQNSFFSNTGLGINLLPPPNNTVDGVTPNDPQDPDGGANNLQNFPVITIATVGSTAVAGTLNTTPSSTSGYTIEVFGNTGCDSSGNGEGKTYLGSVLTGNTDPSGNVSFTVTVPTLTTGQVLTATATDSLGNTSEFSACYPVTPAPTLSIGDVTLAEGSTPSGTTNFDFAVTLSSATAVPVTVNYSTADGSTNPATGGTDYVTGSSSIIIPAGSTGGTITVVVNHDTVVEPDETFFVNISSTSPVTMGDSQGLGTIVNDDTEVSVAVSPAAVDEDGATNLVYTFTRNGVTTNSLTVNFTVGGSADPNTDYTATGAATFTPPNGTVTFNPSSSTATVTIDPTTDNVVETNESVDLTVAAGTGYGVAAPSSASGTITNDDTDVSVAVSPAAVDEDGATNLVYTFTRNGVTSNSLTVNFTVGGSADPNTDYTQTGAATFSPPNGTVTFNPSSSTATVTINPTTDTDVETDETVDLTVAAGTGYNVASPSSASGTITNDDTDVSVTVSPASVLEDGAANLVYTFARNGVTSGTLTVNFSVGGTATFNTDYTNTDAASFSSSSGTVTFGAGNANAVVTVDPTLDAEYEAHETVILTVTAGTGYNVSSPSSATGTITNDDPIPTTLVVNKTADTDDGFCTLDDCSLREAISNANVNPDTNTILFDIPSAIGQDPGCNPGPGVTRVCTIAPNSALPPGTSPVIIDGYFQTGASPNTKTDNTDDAVILIELTGGNAGPGANGIVLQGGSSSIAGLNINRFDGAGVKLTGLGGNEVIGNFLGTDPTGALGVDGGNTPYGNHFGIFVDNVDDNMIGCETPEERNIISANLASGVNITGANANLNLVWGNLIGTNKAAAALGNGGDGVLIDGGSDNSIGVDLTPSGQGNVIANNIARGVEVRTTTGPATGNVISQNSIYDNGLLGIDLSGDSVTPNDAQDPDTGPNNLQNFPIIRNALVGGPSTIRGTLNSTPNETFTIDLYISPSCDSPGGNGEGKKYLGSTTTTTGANGDGLWSFSAAGVTAGDVITATATDASGNTSEFSKCFPATTFNPGTIGFAVANTDNTETNAGSHTVDIIVNRTGGSDGAVSVDWAVTDGPAGPNAATTPEDYSISSSLGTFNWANGNTAPKTITITVNGDTKFELDETVTLTLSNVTGGASSGTLSSTLTIKNDDPEPTISINDVTHNEGAAGTTSYIFTVSLSNPSYLPINVNYATADDTAIAPTDYTAIPTTAVPTFAPTETSKQVTVLVNGDNTFETTEQFFVNLTSPSNATISDSQGVGTITNDDPVPTISIDDVTQAEGNGPGSTSFDFTVSLTNPSYLPITVDYATSDGTASSLSDYDAIPTTQLTFNPGETTKTVSVQVNGDFAFENNETFFVDLSNLSNATMGDSHGVGTITNDDTPPELSINDRSLNEGTSPGPTTPFTFTVTRTVADAISSVNFATANGSSNPATGGGSCGAGVDYISQSGTLNFPASGPGATSQTITVLVCKDAVFEPNETFVINLSGAVDATITDNQGLGTILNDDVPGTGFLVNTTNDIDDGNCNALHCSLREAINATNTALAAVAINFGIPANDTRHFYYQDDGVANQVTYDLTHVVVTTAVDDASLPADKDPDWPHGWWSILPSSQLPALTKQVFVEGYSQTGATANTLTTGDNAVLRIELDGESAGLVVQGLALNAGVSTARGLVINRFKFDAGDSNPTGVGLRIQGSGSTAGGNFIGTDVSGTLDLGNEGSGINVPGSSATIGGNTPDVFNLISGNDIDGILLGNSNSNVVQGNLIGTKANGTSALGNGGNGINLSGGGSVFNTIGGTGAGEGNTIAFNGADGVRVATAGIGNSIRGNSIFGNGSGASDLGIDLEADGVTANDAKDPDSGANNQQNFPVITSALVTGSTRTITGTLNSTVGQTFTIDFYQSPSCDTSGNGEGKTYLGSVTTAATDANGDVSFTAHPAVLTIGQVVTATATSTGAAFNTSEFSSCFGVVNGAPGAGDIQFTSATYSVAEDVGSHIVAITFTRVGGSNGSISSPFTMSGGTATAGVDYTDASQTVTLNEGETSKTINVTIADDSVYEGNETVNLALGTSTINAANPDGAAPAADPHAAVLTIIENDSAPTLMIDDVTHLEGNSGTTSYTFTVTKSGSTALNTGVSFQTQDGTAPVATAGSDYQAQSGTLSFLPSETTKTITILVNGDPTVEADEKFFVNLTSPTNATIADNQGLGTITNDDTDVTVAVSPASVAEDGSSNLVYTFTRNGVTSGAQTVNFSVGGTATFTTDYTQSGAATFTTSSGTVTFGAGNTTATVTIDPTVDNTVESNETVILTVTSGTGYNVASPSSASGTITNDDTDVTVAVSPTSVAEDGVANLVYTFTRTGVTSGALTANFSVGGTATWATDYTQSGAATFTSSSGTVTFGAGNPTATVTVDPTPDISFEADETVILTVTSGTGYNVASPSSATGTITNDDASGGIIQLSSNIYNTTENSRLVTITAVRSGDTTNPVTVNYSTPDDSEATTISPCNINTSGFAAPRCDFTTALGTLRWAAGDGAPKTFDILISQDSYVELPEHLTVTLSNPTGGAVLGVPATGDVTITDDDTTPPTTNPIDDPTNFVRQHYHDFLNREPDQAGLNFWTNEITSCGSNQQCIDFKRVQVSAAFYLSIEFQDTGYLVERLYKSSYGDVNGTSTFGGPHQIPVPVVRYIEFLGDTQEIGLGVVVGQGNWQQQLEDNKQAFADRFVQRARFLTALPLSMTPAQFVDTLNANAGNPLSAAERNQLVADLTSSTKTRAQVLRAVAEDQDLKTAEFNRAFVLMQYFGYLRRNPNRAQDTDYSGFDFWLTKLNQFNGNFQNADMVKAFITSTEYRSRSGP